MRHSSPSGFASLLLAGVLASGCSIITSLDDWTFGDDDPGPSDAGHMDGGRMDASTREDAGAGVDAGPGEDGGPGCPSGLTSCGGECVDLDSSPEHCGECESACTTPLPNTLAFCTDGSCGWECVHGFDDCNGDPADGCEVEIASDRFNCGACGNSCVNDTASLSCGEGTCRPKRLWTETFGGSGSASVTGIAIDSDGNVYVAGNFQGSISIGGRVFESVRSEHDFHSQDVFVASYTASGEHRWSHPGGGAAGDSVIGIVVDESGASSKVIIAGSFVGTANFGGSDLNSSGGSSDMFIASFDTMHGTHLASRGWGGSGADMPSSIAVDRNGSIYVLGTFSGASADFGGIVPLMRVGSQPNIFIASYFSNYAEVSGARWVKGFGSTDRISGSGVAVDNSANVYIVGSLSGQVTFGPTADTIAAMADDVFVASFNSGGFYRWSMRAGGAEWDTAGDIVVGADGDLYVTGDFMGSATFGGDPLQSFGELGHGDVFFASYEGLGAHRWSVRGGGSNSESARSIAVSPTGNVYSAGDFYYETDLGGGTLTTAAPGIFATVQDTANGSHRASFTIGGPDGAAYGATLGAAGDLACVGGTFDGSVRVGDESLIAIGSSDAFIACFEP